MDARIINVIYIFRMEVSPVSSLLLLVGAAFVSFPLQATAFCPLSGEIG